MLKKVLLIISGLGFLDAIYLSIIKFTGAEAMCLPGIGDCWTVNNSRYSTWNGIPISLFGAAAYLSIFLLLTVLQKISFFEKYAGFLIVGITTLGFLFSLYLTYLQFFVINAICPFCILSAITMTTAFVVSLVKISKEI